MLHNTHKDNMVILPGCLTQMMKFCCPSMIFRKFQETFAHKNSLRHRQIEKALKACSNIAHINRWYQIFLILYPLFVLLPQKKFQLTLSPPPSPEYATTPSPGGHKCLPQPSSPSIPHPIRQVNADSFVGHSS